MSALRALQSVDTDTILNTIDDLRSLNIGDILELPQIIVCGDQSSGKSSVLNAVSTLNFPINDALCTRFATEVIMRPGTPERIVVSIVPASDRSSSKKRELEGFRKTGISTNDIASVIGEATEVMGIDPRNPQALRFSNDILRFEVTSPQQPSLTLVDLPGLFQAPSKDQTDEDTEAVKELVLTYMDNRRSVILVVISAKSDFVLQSVTKYSREVDPRGLRTLGIITKPDKLDPDSESERNFMELAENRLAYLHRGWHVLRNRDYTTRDSTQDQRDEAESAFLSKGVWSRLPTNHKGIFTLRSRLSGILRDQIVDGLPGLIEDAKREIENSQNKLSKLGMSRRTPEDRRIYLMRASQTFNITMWSCVNGSYNGKFFANVTSGKSEHKRLRAIVQNTLVEFADAMQTRGHAKNIVDLSTEEERKCGPRDIKKVDFEDQVMDVMKRSRGRELVGMHNPLILHELFAIQSNPWSSILLEFWSKVLVAANITIDLVLHYATDETTEIRLKQIIIGPALRVLSDSVDAMIKKLLLLRHEQHPITYSPRLVQSIQKARQAYADKVIAQTCDQAIDSRQETVSTVTVQWLLQHHINIEPTTLERFAASEAIEVMRAYYKASIAKERVVDNFSTLAIEDCLISRLPDLLSPEKIARLEDDIVESIAMETDAAASERAEAEERLESCQIARLKLEGIMPARRSGKCVPVITVEA